MGKKIGKQTVLLSKPVGILDVASIASKKEGDGPLGQFFDRVEDDLLHSKKTWEEAESAFAIEAMQTLCQKTKIPLDSYDFIIAGDLLNQNMGSVYSVRGSNAPYIGVFSACAAIGEAMGLGSMLIDGGFANNILTLASSHFCAAEKQFRFPLEMGSQRPQTASWTTKGAAAISLCQTPKAINITSATMGKIVDLGIKDANNMGAAMAPAAADTIITHLSDSLKEADYYDIILTGDLGHIGSEILIELCNKEGINIRDRHKDCGIDIFDRRSQDTHNGGSGPACSAMVFAAYYYNEMKKGNINRLLFIPTGALMSPTSLQQGESIAGVAYAICIERS